MEEVSVIYASTQRVTASVKSDQYCMRIDVFLVNLKENLHATLVRQASQSLRGQTNIKLMLMESQGRATWLYI